MKTLGQIVTKAPAPLPPANWEKARLDSVERFLRDHGAWLATLEHSAKPPLNIGLHCQNSDQRRAAIVLLSAQVRYWRKLAEDRQEALSKCASEDALEKWELDRMLKAAEMLKAAGRCPKPAPPKWGGRRTRRYDWLQEDWHRGAELRAALGYGDTWFLKLTRKFTKPPQIRAEGRDKLFSPDAALVLLKHRLETTAKKKRGEIAEEIWTTIQYFTSKRLPSLRAVLRSAGAKCAPAENPAENWKFGVAGITALLNR